MRTQNTAAPTADWALPGLALCVTLFAGCAADWDPDVVFPPDFAGSYQKLHGCSPSAHPAAKYVVTWLSPDGKDAMASFVALPVGATEIIAWPVGMVLVKAQYDDAGCKDLKAYTAMKRLPPGTASAAGDWRWQHLSGEGECYNCDGGTGCSGCHVTPACNGLVCTRGPP